MISVVIPYHALHQIDDTQRQLIINCLRSYAQCTLDIRDEIIVSEYGFAPTLETLVEQYLPHAKYIYTMGFSDDVQSYVAEMMGYRAAKSSNVILRSPIDVIVFPDTIQRISELDHTDSNFILGHHMIMDVLANNYVVEYGGGFGIHEFRDSCFNYLQGYDADHVTPIEVELLQSNYRCHWDHTNPQLITIPPDIAEFLCNGYDGSSYFSDTMLHFVLPSLQCKNNMIGSVPYVHCIPHTLDYFNPNRHKTAGKMRHLYGWIDGYPQMAAKLVFDLTFDRDAMVDEYLGRYSGCIVEPHRLYNEYIRGRVDGYDDAAFDRWFGDK